MRLTLLDTGYCTALERIARRDGRWARVRFPCRVALLEDGDDVILVDTGYAPRFHAVMAETWAGRLFARAVLPAVAPPEASAAAQLRARGVAPEAVTHVVVTHFHADHVAGLRDFPRATFHFRPDALRPVEAPRGLEERVLFRRGFLPNDFAARARPITDALPLPEALAPFATGFDVLGDGRLVGIDLPGHAPGQMGVLVETDDGPVRGAPTLLAADAAWHPDALVRPGAAPSALGLRLQHDPAAYRGTLARLRALHARRPDLRIVLCHG